MERISDNELEAWVALFKILIDIEQGLQDERNYLEDDGEASALIL